MEIFLALVLLGFFLTALKKVFARNISTASPYEVVHVSEVRKLVSVPPPSTNCQPIRAYQINVPVRLQTTEQEAIINPGDYLVGDLNGVVCLPKHLAEKTLALMGPQVEADRRVALDIQFGHTFLAASMEHRGAITKP